MTDTSSSTSERLSPATTSVVADEVRQFASHAGDWWDPDGSERMLHKLNPVRLAYIRDMIDQHWQGDEHGLRPLAGKTALDVGCGAGLLAEPLARLGASVTAVDAAAELIDVAKAHAAGQGLEIDYRHAAVESIGGRFDLVTSMEVIEHVADPQAFLTSLAAVKLIEPGHFKTGFIGRSLRMARHPDYDKQLANYMDWVMEEDRRAPDAGPVAEAILAAAEDTSSRLRYPVKGRLTLFLSRWVPDAMWRSLLGQGMTRPVRKKA